jgi:acetyl-CoA synthetase
MGDPVSLADADEPGLRRWASAASQLRWDRPPAAVLDPPAAGAAHPSWFPGGHLNVAVNCVDRHLETRADQVALHWEGEPGDRRSITYADLHREVTALADALAGLGIAAGDRVALHVGPVPEAVVAMLACARLGAVHAILPAVLPADALIDRLRDLQPRLLLTQDGAWRRGVILPLKFRADEALTAVGSVEQTVVVRRAGIDVPWFEGDRWYHELVAAPRPGLQAGGTEPRSVPSAAPLLITYAANRRGRPTGMIHGTAGLLAYCLEMHRTFAPDPGDVLWAPAELGWAASQTHGILGPLAAGGTTVLYEGMLDTPTQARAWDIVRRYRVSTLLATPSVARALHHWVDAAPTPEQVASLSLIVTAGESIEAATERWLRKEVGRGRVSVVNGWGQTELGGVVALQPDPPRGGAPDAALEVVDEAGAPVQPGQDGELVLLRPWPATALGVHGAPEFILGLDARRPGSYVTGDRARRRADGTIEFLGRTDRVFSVSGQLVSATEVKEALEEHPFVRRAEAIDRPDPRTGRAVVGCVELTPEADADVAMATELRMHVDELLGGLAKPRTVAFVEAFPAEAEGEALVRALQGLCAGTAAIRHISQNQLAATLGTYSGGRPGDATRTAASRPTTPRA